MLFLVKSRNLVLRIRRSQSNFGIIFTVGVKSSKVFFRYHKYLMIGLAGRETVSFVSRDPQCSLGTEHITINYSNKLMLQNENLLQARKISFCFSVGIFQKRFKKRHYVGKNISKVEHLNGHWLSF